MPRIRTEIDDFEVEELAAYEPSGEGPFLWLWIEKRDRPTDEVARELARHLGLAPKHVGWAGRKDRRAVTRQWLSVPAADAAAAIELPGVRVLRAARHGHRLRVGQLDGNRFRLLVREVDSVPSAALERIARVGLPNRFGPQRYGRDGGNARRGLEILRGERKPGERRRARLLLSALQSWVFDAVVDARTDDLGTIWPGDVVVDHATRETRWVDLRAEADELALEQDRADAFEISPTGPLFGTKEKTPRGRARDLERQVLIDLGFDPAALVKNLRRLPRGLHLYGDRRPLRVRPSGLQWTADAAGPRTLELRFDLRPGAYATTLLSALFPEGYDEGAIALAPGGAELS